MNDSFKIELISHIEKVYRMELIQCSIPKNDFQYFKRYIYLYIYNNISKKLFFFLRDKISPIKFLNERPDGSLHFHKRNSDSKISIEVIIKPIPPEVCIYYYDEVFANYENKITSDNYKIELYYSNWSGHIQYCSGTIIKFLINHIDYKKQIDYGFSKVDELKTELRDHKLNNLLSV